MSSKFDTGRKMVNIELFTQGKYTENPFRQVEYEVLLIEKGQGTFFYGSNGFKVKEGDVLFINSFDEHYFKKSSKNEEFLCCRLLFEISALGLENDPCREFFLSVRFCRFLQLPQAITGMISEFASEKSEIPGKDIVLRSILMDVLSYAIKTKQYEMISEISSARKRSLSAIENSVAYIRENYTEYLNLGSLLQLTNYSKSQFIRLFKESTGMNVSEYINKYRIEKACLDLIYTNKNITEIATASGFNNIQYFSRKFKEYMKCTPKQYQKKSRKLTERREDIHPTPA